MISESATFTASIAKQFRVPLEVEYYLYVTNRRASKRRNRYGNAGGYVHAPKLLVKKIGSQFNG